MLILVILVGQTRTLRRKFDQYYHPIRASSTVSEHRRQLDPELKFVVNRQGRGQGEGGGVVVLIHQPRYTPLLTGFLQKQMWESQEIGRGDGGRGRRRGLALFWLGGRSENHTTGVWLRMRLCQSTDAGHGYSIEGECESREEPNCGSNGVDLRYPAVL